MSWEIVFVFATILVALALFISERYPVDQVSLAIPVVLLLAGILTPAEAIAGFSSEATVTGYVGDQRVQVTQRRQLDGHMLSGYLGAQRFTLKEREMPGDGVQLEPIEYLAALADQTLEHLASEVRVDPADV